MKTRRIIKKKAPSEKTVRTVTRYTAIVNIYRGKKISAKYRVDIPKDIKQIVKIADKKGK